MRSLEEAARTPLAYIVLLAYATLALVTDPFGPDGATLVRYGACVPLLVQDGEPWRLLSHAFLHGGLIHLLFNAMFLYQLGPTFEHIVGSPRFALIYVVSAVTGAINANLWSSPETTMVGGSGALFGILGAIVALNMRRGRHLLDFLNYTGPRQVLVLIGVNLMLGLLMPMISNAAHIGGLIGGFVLVFCFLEPGRAAADRVTWVIRAGCIALFASLLFYCMNPVARWDYLLRRALQSREPEVAAQFDAALRANVPPGSVLGLLAEFASPGVPGYLKLRVERWAAGR